MSEYKDYCCTYVYAGATWGLTIRATSQIESRARLSALGKNGTVDGELMAKIPAVPGAGLLTRLIVWIKNGGR